MRLLCIACVLSAALLIAIGCTGARANPDAPDGITAGITCHEFLDPQHNLWGYWNIRFEPANLTAIVVPERYPDAHFNVTDAILPPKCDDCLEINVNSFDPDTRIMDVDVTLRNETGINGFDVRGILYTNEAGHVLTNPDDWTAAFDIPGGMQINPCKVFAKDIMEREFATDEEYTENYLVRIPIPAQYAEIKFAVDVCFPGNCGEPYAVDNFVQQQNILSTPGSAGIVHVGAYDWQDDITSVKLSAPELTGADYVDFTFIDDNMWELELTNTMGAPDGEYEVMVVATTDGAGVVELFDFFTVTIGQKTHSGWVKTWGGNSFDGSSTTAIDPYGNIFVAGFYLDEVDLDPGVGVEMHNAGVAPDAYLSKFNSDGILLWTRTWGIFVTPPPPQQPPPMGRDPKALGLAVDNMGNAYATGFFEGELDFDTDPQSEDIHFSNGMKDAFICKYNPIGDFQWAATWGSFSDDFAEEVDVDPWGNPVVTGYSVAEDEKWDAFLMMFDTDGNLFWETTWGGSSNDGGLGVAIDGMANIYVSGWFMGTVDFDPGPGENIHASKGTMDIFLSKFNSFGEFLWARTWGGNNTNYNGWIYVDESGNDIALDNSGNIYVTGHFIGTPDFDPGPGVQKYSAVGADVFLSKFDPDGNFIWARTWGGADVSTSYWSYGDDGFGVTVDDWNNIFAVGRFMGPADFDPGPTIDQYFSNGPCDAFLTKFDANGVYQWARTWGGEDLIDDNSQAYIFDEAHGVSTDQYANIYPAGVFCETVDLDPGPGIDEYTSNGFWDVSFTRFLPDGTW